MENNAQKLQALLYMNGGEVKKKDVATMLNVSIEDLATYTLNLKELIKGQGIELIETDTTLSLRTAASYAEFLTDIQKKDSQRDVGTAGLEVLAIVLYKEGASRASIDYIRGVNSSGTLRQLVLRGLLERKRDEHDARAWVYSATPELLAHLNVSSHTELPQFAELETTLEGHENLTDNDETQNHE